MRNCQPCSGGTIGLFAPSSPFEPARLERGENILKDLGFSIFRHPQLFSKTGYLAGNDEERAEAFYDLLSNDDVDIIMAARGGYGIQRLLPLLALNRVRHCHKPIVGFSDITALHAFIQGQADLTSIHGPVVTQLGDLTTADHEHLRSVLAAPSQRLHYHAEGPVIRGGTASGPLVGGCLSVLVGLIGTPWLFMPKGAILLLEDVGEAPYRIDRMLTHLKNSGLLNNLAAVALGDFVGSDPARPGDPDGLSVLKERLSILDIPVLAGLPLGHGAQNQAIVLGAPAKLDAKAQTLIVNP